MAQSLRRPLAGLARYSHGLPPHLQCFSQLARVQSQSQSMRVMPKDPQAYNDLGLLEKTWIHPTAASSFGLLKSPRQYFELQYHRLKFRFRDLLTTFALKIASPKDKGFLSRKVKLHRSAIKPAALALHKQMYTAFAEGDTLTLRRICTDGIYESFCARIASRRKGEKVVWELVKYNRRPKIVSNRAVRLPMEGGAIRQVVVRICSRQKLTRWRYVGAHREIVPGTGKERDVMEYVVLQMLYYDWKGRDWQVWGTTKESTYEDVKMWEEEKLR